MTVEEAKDIDKDQFSANFIIELINEQNKVTELNHFYDEIDLLFVSDEENESYSKFEKVVVYEHFHNRLEHLLNQKKHE